MIFLLYYFLYIEYLEETPPIEVIRSKLLIASVKLLMLRDKLVLFGLWSSPILGTDSFRPRVECA